jgi:NADH dehydrogenase
MPDDLSAKAQSQLEKLGVDVRVNARVTALDAEHVEVKPADGEPYRIATRCITWAAGVAANPLGRQLAEATGAQVDRAGRVRVEPDLTLPRHPEISVVGDLAAANSYAPGRDPRPVPGVSPGAKQMGRWAAANILRRLRGEPARPFRFATLGQLASLGRRSGVAQILGVNFSGFVAWWLWRTIYLSKLPRFEKKVRVALDWTLDLLFTKDLVQFQTAKARVSEHATEDIRNAA